MDRDRTIIILDDEIIAAMGLQLELSKAGYERVYIATNYNRAMELCESIQPAIAIVDINLQEEKTGLDFVRDAKGISKVIILTGYGKQLYQQELASIHYDHYIEKPAGPQTVIRSITT